MATTRRWFWVGARTPLRAALAEVFGAGPATAKLAEAGAGDAVVVDARAGGAEAQVLSTGHVFGGVRALKDKKGLAVYVVADAGDRVAAQLARFVLADGVLTWDEAART
ncbi:MAG: hypothetical protein WAT39_04615, partial [Planctomycetota bacterium]